MRFRHLIFGCSLVAAAHLAHGGAPDGMTPGELALTPEFCQDVQTVNGWVQHQRESPRAARWVALMGQSFWGMHHYCWALINTRRALRPGVTAQVRDYLIDSAIEDYMYVVHRAPVDMVLLPEIHYLIGNAHLMLKRYGLAMTAFDVSRNLKPDYWPPYVALAGIHELAGKKDRALAVIADGLRHAPDDKTLLGHFKRLGGSRPPEPLPKRAPDPVPAGGKTDDPVAQPPAPAASQ